MKVERGYDMIEVQRDTHINISYMKAKKKRGVIYMKDSKISPMITCKHNFIKKRKEKVLGSDNINTIKKLGGDNINTLLYLSKKVLGSDNINTLWSLSKKVLEGDNINNLLVDLKRREVFDLSKKVLGSDNINTLWSLSKKVEGDNIKKGKKVHELFDLLVDLKRRDDHGYIYFGYQPSDELSPMEKKDIKRNIAYLVKEKKDFDSADAQECKWLFEEIVDFRERYRPYYDRVSEDGEVYLIPIINRDRIHNEAYWDDLRRRGIHSFREQYLKGNYIFSVLLMCRKYEKGITLDEFFKRECKRFDRLYENLYKLSKRKKLSIPLRILDFYEVDGEFYLLQVIVFWSAKEELKRLSIPKDCEVEEFNMKDRKITEHVIVNKLLSGWFYKKISWTTVFFYWRTSKVPVRGLPMKSSRDKKEKEKEKWRFVGVFNQETLADYLHTTYNIDLEKAKRAWHSSFIRLVPVLDIRWKIEFS